MNSSIPAIEYENINKSYGTTLALKDFSLTVDQGDFLGLLGPNGAGKTTAVHLATGLAKIQDGHVRVHGHDVRDDYQEARSKIGLAPQEANFDRFFSAIDCLTYQGGYFGLPADRSRERAHELLNLFGIENKKNTRPTQLSGGQKRRLLIAKALVHDPDVLILDEPTASLDVELRRQLWSYLRNLKNEGKTIVMTTHYIEEVEALAEKVAILENGELILSDDTEKILREHGRYQYVLRVDNISESLRELLTDRFSFVYVNDESIMLNKKELGKEFNEIVQILNEESVEIESLNYQETELEEIFMEKVYQDD